MNEIAKYLTKSTMSGNDIAQVIEMIDQESANSVYQKCAEEFNFRIVTVESTVYSTTEELYLIFGYSQSRNVMKVLTKNAVETRAISGFRQIDVSHIRQGFGLSKSDFSTRLIDYHGFLTIALEGHGTACDKVREYLLAMEQKARVDSVVYETTGMDAADFQEVAKYAEDPLMQSMMEGQRRMKEIMQLRAQQLETQERVQALESTSAKIEATLEEKVSITPQQEHLLNLRKEELISLQVRNGKDKNRAYQHFWRTVKDRFSFGVWIGLERSKFPLVMEYLDKLIVQEQEKLNQLTLFKPFFSISVKSPLPERAARWQSAAE